MKRIFYERLTEPLHLNLLSLFVMVVGSFRLKVAFDLVLRHQHAYGILKAADDAKKAGKKRVSIIEFGVATGAGLLNIQSIARRVTKITGIEFDIYGFDTGGGMPSPKSYKDHPDLYAEGDFPMDFERLQNSLDLNTKLVIGPIKETLPNDVDFYSSSVDLLKVLEKEATEYLQRVTIYLDDIQDDSHNTWCGELAAINEFTHDHEYRKIERHTFLRGYRLFKNARWIDHMFFAHILDHPNRSDPALIETKPVILDNPLL